MCVKGRPLTPEHRAKLSVAHRGKNHRPEHVAARATAISKAKRARTTNDATSKVCPTCRERKPYDAFTLSRRRWDGREVYCRECRNKQLKARRAKDAPRQRQWREANRERLLEEKRAWYRANRERAAVRDRARYLANRDAKIAYQKAYYYANRETLREAGNARARANRKMYNEWSRRRHARKRQATVFPIPQVTLDARWDFYGGLCWICGGSADTWDHVKPLVKGGAHIPANLRPACKSCNCSKRAKWPFVAAA